MSEEDAILQPDLPEAPSSDVQPQAMLVDVDGYEGPLDVLLMLARNQKVDLKKIAILPLAEQYLEFVQEARKLRIELAADYLVMAAWLAYLKSRLLLPPDEEEEGPSGEEMAARLQFQLQRLEGMREVAARLFGRKRKGIDFFPRGMPEGIRIVRKSKYDLSLYELLKAYAEERTRHVHTNYEIKRPPVWSMEQALKRLEAMVGKIPNWERLETFLPVGFVQGDELSKRSAIASTFAASLELTRDGHLEINQEKTFGPIFLRGRTAPASLSSKLDLSKPAEPEKNEGQEIQEQTDDE